MNLKILLLSFGIAHCVTASEKVKNYFYNATNKKILYRENRTLTKHPLEPKQLVQIRYSREPKFIYWIGDNQAPGNLSAEPFKEKFPEGFVIIFETAASELGAIKRIISKKQFDEEYAKAMKETQKKYTPAIQEGTPLPPPLCRIVSEYYVEKPE